MAIAVVGRRPWWPLAVPAVWVAVEWLRDRWPFGGFPWGRLAFGQADGPLLPLAAWGGAPLVTFAALAMACGLAWLAVQALAATRGADSVRRPWPAPRSGAGGGCRRRPAGGPRRVVAVPTAGTTAGGKPSHVVVAAVQGNVPRLGLDAFAQERAVTANHAARDPAAGRRGGGRPPAAAGLRHLAGERI